MPFLSLLRPLLVALQLFVQPFQFLHYQVLELFIVPFEFFIFGDETLDPVSDMICLGYYVVITPIFPLS
jgi:hypothetical protein